MSAEYFQHEERRPRVLLIHKEEARKWMKETERAGMTIVPLKAYFNEQNRLKIQVSLLEIVHCSFLVSSAHG